MKKTILATLFATSILVVGANTAFAADAPVKIDENSEVGITITDGATKPGQGPYKDSLTVPWVPQSFQFGTQEQTESIATYSVKPVAAGLKRWLVVNDDRPDTTTAARDWSVKASFSELVNVQDPTAKLAASLKMTLNEVKGYDMGTKLNADGTDYVPNNPNSTDPLVPSGISDLTDFTGLTIGGTAADKDLAPVVELGSASTGIEIIGNQGTTKKESVATDVSNIQLVVPAGTKTAGSYTGQVVWSIANTY